MDLRVYEFVVFGVGRSLMILYWEVGLIISLFGVVLFYFIFLN